MSEFDNSPADYYRQSHLVIDERNVDIFRGGWMGQGGFYARPFTIKAGERKKGHAHEIDHLGLLLSGQARLHWRAPDGTTGTVELLGGWSMLHIAADYWHEIEAITDVEWCCLFAKAEADRVLGADTQIDWTMEKSYV